MKSPRIWKGTLGRSPRLFVPLLSAALFLASTQWLRAQSVVQLAAAYSLGLVARGVPGGREEGDALAETVRRASRFDAADYAGRWSAGLGPLLQPLVARALTLLLDELVGGLFGSRLAWAPDSRSVLFAALERTAGRVYRATLEGKVEALTSGPEVSGAPSIDGKGETLVFLREDSVMPREVWTMRLAAPSTPKPLTDTNPQARDLLSFPKELVTWKGADGWDIEGLLVYPAGHTKGPASPWPSTSTGARRARTRTRSHPRRRWPCRMVPPCRAMEFSRSPRTATGCAPSRR